MSATDAEREVPVAEKNPTAAESIPERPLRAAECGLGGLDTVRCGAELDTAMVASQDNTPFFCLLLIYLILFCQS